MEQVPEDPTTRPEGEPEGESDPFSLLTETQHKTRKMRFGAIEQFPDDRVALREVISFADRLDSMILLWLRGGKNRDRFNVSIRGTPAVETYIVESLTKQNGGVIETPKDSINPDHASQTYFETNIPGFWIQRIQPKDSEMSPSYSLVGSDHIPTSE